MARTMLLTCACLAILASATRPGDPNFGEGETWRLTWVVGTGEPGFDPSVFEPDLSGGGEIACFHSRAVNLVLGGTDGTGHVYYLDPLALFPLPRLVSAGPGGEHGNGDSFDPVVCKGEDVEGHEGRYIAFVSAADNLVEGDTNGIPDIFVYDRIEEDTVRVSVDSEGNEGFYEGAHETICHADVSISDDGRYVAFVSLATLHPADTNAFSDIYLHDRDHDEDGVLDEQGEPGGIRTWIASLNERGEPLNGHCGRPNLSGNGEKLAWVSWATNVLPDTMPPDPNDDIDGFCTDAGELRRKGIIRTVLITMSMDGGWQNVGGCTPSVSCDGRYVSFTSHSTNLAPHTGPITEPPPSEGDVPLKAFIRDMWDAGPEKILHLSRSHEDGGPPNESCFRTHLSFVRDRLFVTFSSDATNLSPLDTDPVRDVYVVKLKRTEPGRPRDSLLFLASRHFPEGVKGDGPSTDSTLSNEGNVVGLLFVSGAQNWGGGPHRDLYLTVKRLVR